MTLLVFILINFSNNAKIETTVTLTSSLNRVFFSKQNKERKHFDYVPRKG